MSPPPAKAKVKEPPRRVPAKIPKPSKAQPSGPKAKPYIQTNVPAAKPGTSPATQKAATTPPAPTVDQVWSGLQDFSDHAVAMVSNVARNLDDYMKRYDSAYEAFTNRLIKAEKKAAAETARNQKLSIVVGVVIGTGIGLAAGEFLAAAEGIRAVVNEAGEELVGAGAAAALSPPVNTVDFKPPPEAAADKEARKYWEQMAKASLALNVVQGAIISFMNATRKDAGSKAPATKTTPAGTRINLQQLTQKIAQANRALGFFVAAVDTPILSRSARTIERDLWVRWMSKGEGNAGTLAKDEDIGQHMRDLSVVGQLAGRDERFSLDAQSVMSASEAEVARLNRLGRIAVVIVPPRQARGRQKRPGIALFRHDAYAAVGRVDPTPNAAVERVTIAWQEGAYLKTGEVVMMADTSPDGLLARRMNRSLSVSSREREDAFAALGEKSEYFVPEAAEAVGDIVWYAVGEAVKTLPRTPTGKGEQAVMQPYGLTLSKSEDGVLVSEPTGKAVILFTPYESWGSARNAGNRAGTKRVVAIVLGSALASVQEFESGDVLVTKQSDDAFLARQILEARRALGLPSSSPTP